MVSGTQMYVCAYRCVCRIIILCNGLVRTWTAVVMLQLLLVVVSRVSDKRARSRTVDVFLAAERGGPFATTVPGELYGSCAAVTTVARALVHRTGSIKRTPRPRRRDRKTTTRLPATAFAGRDEFSGENSCGHKK